MSSHTRGGDSGRSRGSTPSEPSAAATALAMTPPTGMMPPSPAPLAPSGLVGDGLLFERHGANVGEIARGRQQIVRERAGQQLSVPVVDEMLQEGAAEALHDRADGTVRAGSAD